MEYTFTLRYKLADGDQEPDEVVERLAEAGCDDALVGIGQRGYLALEFNREAQSALEAFQTALADVRSAIPDAALVEAAPTSSAFRMSRTSSVSPARTCAS